MVCARWGGAVALLGGVGYLWQLTYYELSWDIMEPVTYFIGSSFAIVAYFWWLMSRCVRSFVCLVWWCRRARLLLCASNPNARLPAG